MAKVVGAEEVLAQLSDEDLEEPVGDGEEVSIHTHQMLIRRRKLFAAPWGRPWAGRC